MKAFDINLILQKEGIIAPTIQEGVTRLVMKLHDAEAQVVALIGDACEVEGADPCGQCLACLSHENNALRIDRNAWRDAVVDAAVVDWIYSEEHKDNPRLMVNDLLVWQQKIALDPAVSKEASDWRHEIDALTIELAFLKGKYAGTPFEQLMASLRRFWASLFQSSPVRVK